MSTFTSPPQTPDGWQENVAARIADKLKSSGKDCWDKLNILLPVIATIAIALIGWHFTHIYETNQHEVQKAELLQKYLPDIEAGGAKQAVAIVALSKLGYREIAIEMAVIYGSSASADAITLLGQQASNAKEQSEYFAAYRDIVEAMPSLSLVGEPSFINAEPFTETRYREEEKTKTHTVLVPVFENKTKTVEVTEVRPETRTRQVPELDPITGQQVLDESGNPVMTSEEYIVDVPVTVTKEVPYSVQRMIPETKAKTYTVKVPYEVTMYRDVAEYDSTFSKTSIAIRELLEGFIYTSVENLIEDLAKKLSVSPEQKPALRRQVAWQTFRNSTTGQIGYLPLPEPILIPQTIRQPLPDPEEVYESSYPSAAFDDLPIDGEEPAPPIPAQAPN